MEYNNRLNELKSLILAKLGIRFITPADCKRISIEISKHLNKNVSETTIKRLFGFAVVKHNFSTFTLTTLAEYVDIAGIEPQQISIRQEGTSEWQALREKADLITNQTLKTIRNRSGIPYDMTVGRKFAEHDFEEFYKGEYIFTTLVSQPGYGKTILLSHLTESLFYRPNAPYKNSGILFIKAYNLFNKDAMHLHLEEQLKLSLQIDSKENVLEYINNIQKRNGGKFIIIIDGFAELILKKEDKNLLFDSLINLICSLEDYKNIKLMMSMRSTTWTRLYDRMRHSAFLKAKWFPGGYFNLHELSNVPPLNEKEIEHIMAKINYVDEKEINPRLKAQLKFPFHVQLYYQLKEEDPDFKHFTNITFYELVSRFIQEKIYRSNYYTEKILFLKRIIKLTGYGKISTAAEKDLLLAELSMFRNAYTELLSDGILMEEKRTDNAHPKEFVRFLHPHMFEYFLFVEILEKFHMKVNKDFFGYINNEYDFNQVRFQLLQWTTRFLIKTGNFTALRTLFKLDLNSFETNYLILFIAEEIKYRSKYNGEILLMLEEDKFHDVIITKLINFDFIDSCYQEAVIALIEIASSNEHLSIYYSILGILDIIRMSKTGIHCVIEKMDTVNLGEWPVNPKSILELIFAKINGDPPVHHELLRQINEFKNGKNPFPVSSTDQLNTKEAISYILLLMVNVFTGDHYTGSKLIESVVRFHPREVCRRSNFSLNLLSVYGIYGSRATTAKKISQIENIMVLLATKQNLTFTKYQESVLLMFRAQRAYHKKEYALAIDYARESLDIFKRNKAVLNAIFMLNLLVLIYTEIKKFDMANEYKYEKISLLDDKKLSRQLF